MLNNLTPFSNFNHIVHLSFQGLFHKAKRATFIISSRESAERKAADVKDRDEGIASAILKERSLTDALCSRPIPDEIMKVAAKRKPEKFYR